MKAVGRPKKVVRAHSGGDRWPNCRLTLALRILSTLPMRPPGLTSQDICDELEINDRRLRSLIEAIRDSGIAVESQFNPDGRKGFYIGVSQQLVEKVFGIK